MQDAVNLRILLVDDDSDLRELFAEALRERGYYCAAAGSAEEALERLSKDEFNIVVCDMVMPGMDGIELLKRIKRSCPEMLPIMITGDGAIETASKAIEAGAFGYMTKPFRLDEFLIIIKNAADSSLGINGVRVHEERVFLKKRINGDAAAYSVFSGGRKGIKTTRIADTIKKREAVTPLPFFLSWGLCLEPILDPSTIAEPSPSCVAWGRSTCRGRHSI